ncbi:transposase family protein, partial [Frankia sp. CgMI4]
PEQALLVLVHLRKGERYEQLAEGFQVRSVIMSACAGTLS